MHQPHCTSADFSFTNSQKDFQTCCSRFYTVPALAVTLTQKPCRHTNFCKPTSPAPRVTLMPITHTFRSTRPQSCRVHETACSQPRTNPSQKATRQPRAHQSHLEVSTTPPSGSLRETACMNFLKRLLLQGRKLPRVTLLLPGAPPMLPAAVPPDVVPAAAAAALPPLYSTMGLAAVLPSG